MVVLTKIIRKRYDSPTNLGGLTGFLNSICGSNDSVIEVKGKVSCKRGIVLGTDERRVLRDYKFRKPFSKEFFHDCGIFEDNYQMQEMYNEDAVYVVVSPKD